MKQPKVTAMAAEHITGLKRKIRLLEVERKACYDRHEAAIMKNQELIHQLREDNRRLHRKLAGAHARDEHVIRAAFQNRARERESYRNKSVKEIIGTLDECVLSNRKRLNALKHGTEIYERRREELKMEYRRMKPEHSAAPPGVCTLKKEENAMNLRVLENSLEKSQFKCKEAENIMIDYLKLKSHLQDESLAYQSQLDSLQAEILKHREELRSLQVVNTDSQLSKEAAKAELQQQEELLHKECKEREQVIASYRKKVDERKDQAAKIERRVQRAAVQLDELSSEVQHSTTRTLAEEEKDISTAEEAFRRIKEATGITDIEELEEHFTSQKETRRHLERQREENEEVLLQLKEQKELLEQQFEEMKYSGEAKLSSHQQTLQEREQQLQAEQQRCDEAEERLDWLVKTLGAVRHGVEHLADNLQHISLDEHTVPNMHPDSEDFVVLELVAQCEQKLESLQKELEGKDVAAIMKEMEEKEFYVRIEGKLPEHSTQVKPPEDQAQDPYSDEDKSDKDGAHIISREALKRQSQLIVDSNSKRKAQKKRKGKF
ncbi:outer dynein arm-docking complex subunit 3-like [Pelmatolapia mariae]|uniref:outer dynein arm-docking complex subunit 3-like n=1 Tax=Pelmatolapia mariae TaxID=158779 RepID=UPI002FE533BD